MTKNLFDRIYDESILPFIRTLAQNNPLLQIKNMDQCKEDIYNKYCGLKQLYKDQIFDKTDEALLDRHKVASCICAAFLQVSVFNTQKMIQQIIDTRQAVHSYFFYANEFVALYAANRFMSYFMICDYKGNLRIQRDILEKFPLIPPIVQSKKGFWTSVLFNLASIKDEEVIGLQHFDIYAYAIIFFMLEVYYEKEYLPLASA